MSRAARRETSPEDTALTRSVLEPGHSTYALDDDVLVAEVRDNFVRLFDGDDDSETLICDTPEAAHEQALQHAWSFEAARHAREDAQ